MHERSDAQARHSLKSWQVEILSRLREEVLSVRLSKLTYRLDGEKGKAMNTSEFFAAYAENLRRAFEEDINSVIFFNCDFCPLHDKCRADASAGIKEEMPCNEYIKDNLAK